VATFTREERDEAYRKHYTCYKNYVEKIGIRRLINAVPWQESEIREAYSTDCYLNNLPLKKWELLHPHIWNLKKRACISPLGGWSISDSVCLLKHVAIYHVLKETLEGFLEHRHNLNHFGS